MATDTVTVAACQVCPWRRSTADGLTADEVDDAARRHTGELSGRNPEQRKDNARHPTTTTTVPTSPA